MERVKQAAPETNQSGPRVVFVGDGEIPQAIRDLFPGAEFVRSSDMKERIRAATDSRIAANTALAAIFAAVLARSRPEPTPEPEPAHTRRSTDDPLLDTVKPLAFAELDKIAAEHDLSFSDEEREALFTLSKVFDPDVAKSAARAACAMFNEEEQQ